MTVKEYYELIDGDYNEVISHLDDEERVKRILLKLPKDNTFNKLCNALLNGDAEKVISEAHSLRNISVNLGLTHIKIASDSLITAMSGGELKKEIILIFSSLKNNYKKTIDTIKELS